LTFWRFTNRIIIIIIISVGMACELPTTDGPGGAPIKPAGWQRVCTNCRRQAVAGTRLPAPDWKAMKLRVETRNTLNNGRASQPGCSGGAVTVV